MACHVKNTATVVEHQATSRVEQRSTVFSDIQFLKEMVGNDFESRKGTNPVKTAKHG